MIISLRLHHRTALDQYALKLTERSMTRAIHFTRLLMLLGPPVNSFLRPMADLTPVSHARIAESRFLAIYATPSV